MIIKSILDTDLYKLSMQKAILAYRQGVPVKYVFNNRRPEGLFNQAFFDAFQTELHEKMPQLKLGDQECSWLAQRLPWLGEDYIQYLRNYRFDPSEVDAKLINGDLKMEIKGTWERTILWEVPLMALVSELYFVHCDKNWKFDEKEQKTKIFRKALVLSENRYSDFGTRRRRSFETQRLIVETLNSFKKHNKSGFSGTSNVYLAYMYNLTAIGTQAHEWYMAISALESLRHANKYGLKIWSDIYKGNLGIALTDTFGTDAFFKDFDGYAARLFDGLRHDSDDPFKFADKAIAAYQKLGVDPLTKTLVFSDSLTAELAVEIALYVSDRIRCSFGIGTHFTNDFETKALNMVIKLAECNGVPVVKLSDSPTKAIGDKDALRVAFWTFFGKTLDA